MPGNPHQFSGQNGQSFLECYKKEPPSLGAEAGRIGGSRLIVFLISLLFLFLFISLLYKLEMNGFFFPNPLISIKLAFRNKSHLFFT